MKLAVKSRVIWLTALFLFLFNCNPNLGSVFYYYEKDTLKLSDVLIGKIDMVGSIGLMAGAVLFGFFSKRLNHQALLKVIILTGVVGNISYLFFRDASSGYKISGFSGVVSGIAMLGLLTVAAKACPKHVEASVFALLMSVYNLGIRFGDYTGSFIYEHFYELFGGQYLLYVNLLLAPYPFLADVVALFTICIQPLLNVVLLFKPYSFLVIVATLFTACMWFFKGMAKEA